MVARSPLNTVTVQHERASEPRQVRISARVKTAIEAMVCDGLHRSKAAEKAGIADHTLYMALRKAEVLAYLNSLQGVVRTSARARAIAKAESLLDAESEHVRLEAVKYLEPPISKSEITHTHQGPVPGLTIIFAGADQPAMTVIEQPNASAPKGLPQPVLHPSLRGPAVDAEPQHVDVSAADKVSTRSDIRKGKRNQ